MPVAAWPSRFAVGRARPELVQDLREHAGLITQLERARALGFLGPGPVESHIDHAGVFLAAVSDTAGVVLDLGSGGGVPGLVLAVARPDLRLVLLDARAKRCELLRSAVRELGVEAEVVEGRAEVLGRSALRGTADAVVARSFGVPATTAECGSPFLRVGGLLVVSEPPVPGSDRWPVEGLRPLGLTVGARLGEGPSVQLLVQATACPEGFPRPDGQPARRPLF